MAAAPAVGDWTATSYGSPQPTHIEAGAGHCVDRNRSVSQHQLKAYATLVDEVYRTYGNSGDAITGSPPRRVAYSHQKSAPEPLRSDTAPQVPYKTRLDDREGGPQHPPLSPDKSRSRWLSTEPTRPTGDGGECSAVRTREAKVYGSRPKSGAAGTGCAAPPLPLPLPLAPLRRAAPPSASGAQRHTSTCDLIQRQSQLPPLAALPPRLLPRRWTDGAGAAAAAAAANASSSSFYLASGPVQLQPSRPRTARDEQPCRLLELPNELLLLITMACVTRGSVSAGADAYTPCAGSRSAVATPRGAPNSPGWSFALIASPQNTPTRRPQRGWAAQRLAGGAGGGVRGGGGGDSGGDSSDGGLAGLRAVACAAMTCRRLRGAYRLLLAARPDLELQVGTALSSTVGSPAGR